MPSADASDAEAAARLVELYFREIARPSFKKNLDLDAVINAYLYTLGRLANKDKEMRDIMSLVSAEEKALKKELSEGRAPAGKALIK